MMRSVFKLIAELADVITDHGNSRCESAVNQDVAVARGDQERRDIRGADIGNVVDQMEWLERAVHRF